MEPSGDPEARIRDLERPLADQASASEMSTRAFEGSPSANMPVPPYPYSAPPSDPYQTQYGSPYYAPPQQVVRKRSQPAVWLIPLVAGVVIAAGIVGVVVYFLVGSNSATPGTPSVSGGGGSVDVPSIPSIPELPDVAPGIGSDDQVATVEAGGSLSIGGIDKKQTVICNQGVVNVSGMNNTIDVQGSCASVSVSGMNNVVTVEAAATISASGFDNKVTYRGGDPQTSQSGTGNVIEKG